MLIITNRKTFFLLIFLVFTLVANAQKDNRSYAEQQLHSALTDTTQHNVIDNKTAIIKDSLTAINIAESLLFNIYGKDNIIRQRPYETYLIDNYWIISGTLPDGYLGGTFLIIIDARNSRVIRITHGK